MRLTLSSKEIDSIEIEFDEGEAKGVVRLTRGPYGLFIDVDGNGLMMLDLFYKSIEHLKNPGAKPKDVVRLYEYSGDPSSQVKWVDGVPEFVQNED